MSISHIGLAACAFAGLLITARIAILFTFRTAVLARIVANDCTRTERWERSCGGWDNLSEELRYRTVCARVSYAHDGVDYREDVDLTLAGETQPGELLQIWIKPDSPSKATAYGPGYWFIGLVLLSVITVFFWYLPF